jgi:hypothetical protein
VVITPLGRRKHVAGALKMPRNKPLENLWKKRHNIPL